MAPKKDPKAPAKKAEPAPAPAPAAAPEPAPAPAAAPAVDLSAVKVQWPLEHDLVCCGEGWRWDDDCSGGAGIWLFLVPLGVAWQN